MKKYLLAALLLGASVSPAPVSAQQTFSATRLDLNRPTQKLPQPNGWAFIQRALNAMQRGVEGSPSNPEPNRTPEEDIRLMRVYSNLNAQSLRLMREGLQHAVEPPRAKPEELPFENTARLRHFGRLLMQKSRVQVADRQMDEAVQTLLDGSELSVVMQRNGGVIRMLAGGAVASMMRGEMWSNLNQFDAKTAAKAAARIETIEAKSPTLAEILEEEKWNNLSFLQALMRHRDWLDFRRGNATQVKRYREEFGDTGVAALQKLSDAQIVQNFWSKMDEIIAASQLAYSPALPHIAPTADPISSLGLTNYFVAGPTLLRLRYESNRNSHRMLQTALSLHAFHLENGRYPEALTQLVPKYLQSVPLDLFNQNTPLIYKRTAEKFLLYSVGPDAVDNGGTPIQGTPDPTPQKPKPEPNFRVIRVESKGDLVAGINP